MVKVAVGIPAYGGEIASGQAGMWLDFGSRLQAHSARGLELKAVLTVDTCGVDRARNYLLASAMKMGAEWLLMIDADTWVANDMGGSAGEQLISMIMNGMNTRAAIIGAPVYRRIHTRDHSRPDEKSLNVRMFKGHLTPGVQEVEAIGAACMAINLQRIGFAEFKFTHDRSEDLEFCHQVRLRNEKIFVDPNVRTCHLAKPDVLVYDPIRASIVSG
jgi:hypothetical protein